MPATALYLVPDRARCDAALALQSRVWEPAARALLNDLGVSNDADSVLRIGWGVETDDWRDTYDVVHARFQIALHGRGADRLESLRRRVAPGGVLVVEEPDTRTLVHDPYAPAATHLLGRVAQAIRASGGDLDAGRRLPQLMHAAGVEPTVRTHTLGLEPGHPYLHLPLDLADLHAERLADILGGDHLAHLRREAATELSDPARGGTTLTLVQCWTRVP